jgi:hypothetical protein
VISGNIPKMAIVQTNPGYGPNPGHAGTGTVVAIVCGQPLASTAAHDSLFVEAGVWLILSMLHVT